MTVIQLHKDKDPDVVLERCKGEYESLIVLGWSKEQEQLILDGTSTLNPVDVLWLLEQSKRMLLSMGEVEDD